MLVFRSPANTRKPHHQPGLPDVSSQGFYFFQWKLHEALEHLRKEQDEAWKLEVGERKRTATWKAGCHLGKEGWMVAVLSGSWPVVASSWSLRQNVALKSESLGVSTSMLYLRQAMYPPNSSFLGVIKG